MRLQISAAALPALLATAVTAAPAPGVMPEERHLADLNERSFLEARAGLISDLACLPFNLITNALNNINGARASALAFCSVEIAPTVTVTRTSVLLATRTNLVSVPGTAVVTATTAAPVPIVTVTVVAPKVVSTNTALAASVQASGTAAAAPPTYTNCNLAGWDRSGDNVDLRAFRVDNSGTYANFAACQGLCISENNCTTFSYGDRYCFLYHQYPGVYENPVSPYKFFDTYCPPPVGSSSSSSNAKRQLAIAIPARPAVWNGLGAAQISGACSCLVTSLPTVTSEVVVTQASTVQFSVQTNVFISTRTVLALTTPPAATVTLQL